MLQSEVVKPFKLGDLSICIPYFNGLKYLDELFSSLIVNELVQCQLCISIDSNREGEISEINNLLQKYNFAHSIVVQNKENMGYSKNLEIVTRLSNREWILLMGQDDLILPGSIAKYESMLRDNPNISIISRNYYWFENDVKTPIRILTSRLRKNIIVNRNSSAKDIILLLETVGQLSGLLIRRDKIINKLSSNVFTAHVEPILIALQDSNIGILSDNTVAVRTSSSQTRFRNDIYIESPTKQWSLSYEFIKEYMNAKTYDLILRKHMGSNFKGLLQVRIMCGLAGLINEISEMRKLNRWIFFDIRFMAYLFICLVLPSKALRLVIDFTKNNVFRLFLSNKYKGNDE